MVSSMKMNPALKIFNGALRDLPSPTTIHVMWNLGSLLGFCLILQIMTGLFLAMHFSSDTSLSFIAVSHISRDVNSGWVFRALHANGASLFFICLYLHIARGLYFFSFRFSAAWNMGTVLLLLVMATAFTGYVLPWGQMSFWGATVITSLFSALPYIGLDVVSWIWGGFAVDNATLTRFFTFHFLLPILVMGVSGLHLLFLHQSGSSNPLGLTLNTDKTPFHPYFSLKDISGFLLLSMALCLLVMAFPSILGDPENFISANPLVTPVHIQPEWYFLFAYAILRSVPNKLGGVIALASAVMILFIFPLLKSSKFQGIKFYPMSRVYLWMFFNSVILLTWVGARPVETPFISVGQGLTFFYFMYFFLYMQLSHFWDSLLTYHLVYRMASS